MTHHRPAGCRRAAVATLAVLLTACGGGVEDPDAAPAATRAGALAAAGGMSTITVQARGTLVNDVGPVMLLRVDGATVASTQVRALAYQAYTFSVPAVPAGAALDVVFTNDLYLPALGADRNLWVRTIAVDGGVMNPTDPAVRYDRGFGAKAFDGLDLLPGRETMAWAGALRFTVPVAVDATPKTFAFAPMAVPSSGAELANPLRGQYAWHDAPALPAGWPLFDSYARWEWYEIEPSRGQYNWALIDAKVAEARARRGRFGMRIMALCQDCGNAAHRWRGARSSIPHDLAPSVDPIVAQPSDGVADDYLIPDWNSPAYLARLKELLDSIGARYAAEPHFGFVDVSGYGNWGEMHLYPFDHAYTDPLQRQRPLNAASAQALVQMNAAAFAGKLLVTTTAQRDVLAAAVASASPPIGLRIDCFGSDRLAGAENALNAVPGALQRWRIAPVMTEWCGKNLGTSGADRLVQGESQVRQFHVSMLASYLRVDPATPLSATQLAAHRQANVGAGYRLRTSAFSLQTNPAHRTRLRVAGTWVNDNVAPTYLAWRVVLRLRGAVTVELPLNIDLRKVMPDAPLLHEQELTLLQALPPGTYAAELRVDDLQGVSPPMQLAMAGRTSAGTYLLGNVALP